MIRIARKHPRITINPAVMVGKPCIKGTRVPVYLVLSYLGSGQTMDEVMQAYPSLTQEDIVAALRFAADRPAAA